MQQDSPKEPLESTFEASLESWQDLRSASNKQSDLGRVLITISYFDSVLDKVLKFYLIQGRTKVLFDGPNAPLSNFSSKINFAYSMGLISHDEFMQLHALRKVRNVFAHSVKTTFEDAEVVKEMKPLIERHGVSYDLPGTFDFVASRLAIELLNRADQVSSARLTDRKWDIRRTDFDEHADYDPY